MPAVRIDFHPSAIAEAKAAHAWYAQRNERAAAGFLAELDHAVELIAAGPERWPVHRLGTRRLVLRRFPFAIVYRLAGEFVLVLAIAHTRRRPGYWRGRL
jgi:plasmid stabilization system protein ParE